MIIAGDKKLIKKEVKEALEFLEGQRHDNDGIYSLINRIAFALADNKPVKPNRVEISVTGGIVNPVKIPKGIELHIIDYDNEPGKGDAYIIDSNLIEKRG